jgi:hypothetical protein
VAVEPGAVAGVTGQGVGCGKMGFYMYFIHTGVFPFMTIALPSMPNPQLLQS